jgi:hypothetical protein
LDFVNAKTLIKLPYARPKIRGENDEDCKKEEKKVGSFTAHT